MNVVGFKLVVPGRFAMKIVAGPMSDQELRTAVYRLAVEAEMRSSYDYQAVTLPNIGIQLMVGVLPETVELAEAPG